MMKEKAKKILISSGYAALFLLIPIVTILLVAIAQGYRFNFQTGQVVTSGLLLMDSQPDSAHISVDGQYQEATTPERLILPAGEYDVSMERDGYRSWRKHVTVLSSGVTRLQYPLLVLNNITTSVFDAPRKIVDFQQSPNHKHIAFGSTDDNGRPVVRILTTADVNEQPRTVYTVPQDLRQQQAAITQLKWAPDSEHLLVTLQSPQDRYQVVVDGVGDDQPVNMTSLLQLPFKDLRFDQKNWREMYWLSPQGLRRIDLGSETVSAVLASDVSTYTVAEDGVYYVRNDGKQADVLALERDNDPRVVVEGLDPAATYRQLQYLQFDDEEYVAFINRTERRVTLVSNLQPARTERRTFNFAADSLRTSPNTRFLLMRSGGTDFRTFDVDENRSHTYSFEGSGPTRLSWFNETHLIGLQGNSVVLFEFDGGNRETIVDGVGSYPAFGDDQGQRIYSVGRSGVNNNLVIHVSQIAR